MNATVNAKRPVEHIADDTGRACVRVDLIGGLSTIMLDDDYRSLLTDGWSPNMYANRDGTGGLVYVRTARPGERRGGGIRSVARIIMAAGRDQIVKYRNGDRLDLRRDNLYFAAGTAKGLDVSPPAAGGADGAQRTAGGPDGAPVATDGPGMVP